MTDDTSVPKITSREGATDWEYYKRSYTTLGVASLVVLLTFIGYATWFLGNYQVHGLWYLYVELGIGLAFLALTLFGFSFGLADQSLPIFDGRFPLPQYRSRIRLLPPFTISFLILVAGVCYLTGGSRQSPFAHYLVSISTLSIVLASEKKNKVLVVAVAMALYFVVLIRFVSPSGELRGIRGFDFAIVFLSVMFGLLAAWNLGKEKPITD